MNLHEIANKKGYGTGKAARDRLAARAERRALIGDPSLIGELRASTHSTGYMVGALGHCPETNEDWMLEHFSELGLVDGLDDTASNNAKAIAAVWSAYRDGDLVWTDGAQQNAIDARDKIKALEARIEQLEAALATAREDALREAAGSMPDFAVFADGWTPGQCSAAISTIGAVRKQILALIDKEPKP